MSGSDLADANRQGCVEVVPMLRPCGPDATIWLLRLTVTDKPENVDLELVFELVAQLVTDLRGWAPDDL